MLHIESIAIAENLSNLKACAMALKTNYPKEKLGTVRVDKSGKQFQFAQA